MNEGAYRDARTGLLQHIAELDLAAKERRERMTDALLRVLPAELASRIEAGRAVEIADDASVADLGNLAEQRIALVDALDEALALAPHLAETLRETANGVPLAPPQEDSWGPAGTEEALAPLHVEIDAAVKNIDEAATVSVRGTRITVEMLVKDVPVLWLIEVGTAINLRQTFSGPKLAFMRASHSVSAKVPPALPRLAVRRQTIGDAVRAFLTHRHDLEQSDEAFDKTFFIEGDPAFAPPLLRENVRKLMLARAELGGFELRLERGVLELRYSAALRRLVDAETFLRSAEVVAAVRHAATTLQLCHEGTE